MADSAGALLLSPESLRVGAVFLAAAGVTALLSRAERPHVARVAGTYAASILARALGAGALRLAMPTAAATCGVLALLLQGMAFAGLALSVLFGLLLPLVRVHAPRIVRDLSSALAFLGILLWVLSVNQVDVTGLVATSAVVTAVIGFSLQDTLANVMGGLTLQLDGSIRAGDWVKYGETSGRVRELSWRYASIETRNGDTLVVPNSLLIKSPVLVQGRVPGSAEVKERRWVFFGVDHRHTPESVIEAVLDGLFREPIPNVAASPAPSCLLMEFKESWAMYAVRYWLTDLQLDDPTDSVIRMRVRYALMRAGIPLSIPAATRLTTLVDEAERRRREARDVASREAALAAIPLFSTLTEEERARVAERLVFAPFAPGEAMVVQGRKVHSLYILSKGEAEVRVSVEGAPQRAVSRMRAPDIFGEMGLLTGEPRRATVVALTEVECWKLEKERFQEVLAERPAIVGEMSRILAIRDVSLTAAREGLSEEAHRRRLETAHESLLLKIERFFGLTPAGRPDETKGGGHA